MNVVRHQQQVTYKNLDRWYKELEEYCPGIPTIVVANKIDGELCQKLCYPFGFVGFGCLHSRNFSLGSHEFSFMCPVFQLTIG